MGHLKFCRDVLLSLIWLWDESNELKIVCVCVRARARYLVSICQFVSQLSSPPNCVYHCFQLHKQTSHALCCVSSMSQMSWRRVCIKTTTATATSPRSSSRTMLTSRQAMPPSRGQFQAGCRSKLFQMRRIKQRRLWNILRFPCNMQNLFSII